MKSLHCTCNAPAEHHKNAGPLCVLSAAPSPNSMDSGCKDPRLHGLAWPMREYEYLWMDASISTRLGILPQGECYSIDCPSNVAPHC